MNELQKLQNLISLLSSKIDIHEAATGTLYVKYNGRNIRIADHEPNFAARTRSNDYKEMYVMTADRQTIAAEKVIWDIAEYFDLPIEGELKSMLDKYEEERSEMLKEAAECRKEVAKIQQAHKDKISSVREMLMDDMERVFDMVFKAEEEADALGLRADKRRKRRNRIFAEMFKAEMGYDMTYADVNEAFKVELLERNRK